MEMKQEVNPPRYFHNRLFDFLAFSWIKFTFSWLKLFSIALLTSLLTVTCVAFFDQNTKASGAMGYRSPSQSFYAYSGFTGASNTWKSRNEYTFERVCEPTPNSVDMFLYMRTLNVISYLGTARHPPGQILFYTPGKLSRYRICYPPTRRSQAPCFSQKRMRAGPRWNDATFRYTTDL